MKLVLIFICLLFVGCASNVVYRPTYIPTKCQIDLPKKPQKLGNEVKDIQNILIYTELLEFNLKFCIEGK